MMSSLDPSPISLSQSSTRSAPATAIPDKPVSGKGPWYVTAAIDNGLCQRTERRCSRTKVEGAKLCARHLRHTPDVFRRCTYVSSRSALKCPNVCHQNDAGLEGFCMDHLRMVSQMRRQAAYKQRHRDTADSLVYSLRHYRQFSQEQNIMPKSLPHATAAQFSNDQNKTSNVAQKTRNPIDYLSESSDEDEAVAAIDECPQLDDDGLCDGVIDEPTDPLRHAGIYTAEEIGILARDQLIRQQSLYFEYMQLLKEKYRLKRVSYRKKLDDEAKAGPYTVSDYEDYKRLRQLKAMRKYHRKRGMSAFYKQRCKRKQYAGTVYYGDGRICVEEAEAAVEGKEAIKCFHLALPQSDYRLKHIVRDGKQVAFRKCLFESCHTAILAILDTDYCWLHKPVPLSVKTDDANATSFPETRSAATETRTEAIQTDDRAPSHNFARIVDQVVSGSLHNNERS